MASPDSVVLHSNLPKMLAEARLRASKGTPLVMADDQVARIVGWRDQSKNEVHAMDLGTLKQEMQRLDGLWRGLDSAAREATTKVGMDDAWQRARAAHEAAQVDVPVGWPLIRPFLLSPIGRAVAFGVPFPVQAPLD